MSKLFKLKEWLTLDEAVLYISKIVDDSDDAYQTMLTKDGKIVKVRTRTVGDSKVVDKQLSNKSLLKWLDKSEEKS